MARFIRGFHMDEDKVEGLKALQGPFPFAPVIGVKITGCALHVNGLQPRVKPDALQQVHG